MRGIETFRVLYAEITYALRPFNPGRIAWTETLYDYGWVIHVDALNESYKVYPDRYLMCSPQEFAHQIGREAGQYFRDLPAPPLTPNIILSDN